MDRFAGRYDCGCKYKLTASLLNDRHEILYQKEEERQINQWEGRDWKKVYNILFFKFYSKILMILHNVMTPYVCVGYHYI